MVQIKRLRMRHLLLLAAVASNAIAVQMIDSNRYNVTEEYNDCIMRDLPQDLCIDMYCPDGQLDSTSGICYTNQERPNNDNSSSSSSTTPEALITPPPSISISSSSSTTPGPTPTPLSLSSSSSTSITTSTTSSSSAIIVPTPQSENQPVIPERHEEIYVPPALIADEQAVFLTYLANQNQTACIERAAMFAENSTQAVRREFALGLNRARKRSLLGGAGFCLPPMITVNMAVHWVLPKGKTRENWYTPGRAVWDRQLQILREKMKPLNFGISMIGHWFWYDGTTDAASTFSNNYQDDDDEDRINRNNKFIEWAKGKTGRIQPYHLHVFIVDAFDTVNYKGMNGYCRLPGFSKSSAKSDACVIKINALPFQDVASKKGQQPTFPGSDPDIAQDPKYSDRGGVTLPHEMGHFLNLYHLHDGGCVPKRGGGYLDLDGALDTKQYGPSPGNDYPDYSKTCDGTPATETNLMSYSSLRTIAKANTTPEQRIRALTGYMMRKAGFYKVYDDNPKNDKQEDADRKKAKNTIARYFLDNCPFSGIDVNRNVWIKREVLDDGWHSENMNKRQLATALTDFCKRTDLVMQNYVTSKYADVGLFSDDTPIDPAAPPRQDLSSYSEPSADFLTFETDVVNDNSDDIIAAIRESITQNGGSIGSNQNSGSETSSSGSLTFRTSATATVLTFVFAVLAGIFVS